MFFPVILGIGLIVIDICEYYETGRSQTVTLSEGFGITVLFGAVNVPMNFIGTVAGYKWTPIELPSKISRVPRQVPGGLPWFLNFNLMAVISGCVPIFVIGFEIY